MKFTEACKQNRDGAKFLHFPDQVLEDMDAFFAERTDSFNEGRFDLKKMDFLKMSDMTFSAETGVHADELFERPSHDEVVEAVDRIFGSEVVSCHEGIVYLFLDKTR